MATKGTFCYRCVPKNYWRAPSTHQKIWYLLWVLKTKVLILVLNLRTAGLVLALVSLKLRKLFRLCYCFYGWVETWFRALELLKKKIWTLWIIWKRCWLFRLFSKKLFITMCFILEALGNTQKRNEEIKDLNLLFLKNKNENIKQK